MSFTKIKTTQNQFLEAHLRGTGRTLTAAQARSTYGIKNLRARVSELQVAGMRVNRTPNASGRLSYSISSRDVTGSRAAIFA